MLNSMIVVFLFIFTLLPIRSVFCFETKGQDCSKLHQEMKKIIEERKDIAFYIKMFPLKNHPETYEKAKAIVCEKSLTLLEDAHEKKPLPKPMCETTVIDENIKLAEKLGISSSPTLVFPDGRVIVGYFDAKTLITLITMIGN